MKTTDELFADKHETASLHDVVVDALELSFEAGKEISPDKLRRIFNALPERTRDLAHSWGLSDTAFYNEAWLAIRDDFVDFKDIVRAPA